ncbi:MAG: fumarate reductase subunit D [Gammaproteobacteria bacterium]|nr:fumarate reductase subunit D [Gammaproteobacteria bacterium]
MARSNKPMVWSMFAAGGTIAAFVFPALVLLTFMAAYGKVPEILEYEAMRSFAAGWIGKLFLLAVIVPSLWHAAHRLRTALHGLGLRADHAVAYIGYSVAAVGSLLALYYLLQI